ncbi:MAG: endonuclease/exonuclease/phosphatase family protein [Bacteroidia bacterium]|nr:endonuclease/exonuclease/phosphatase family protein [Bacteroidia bacterium]MCF8427617.1 endonuclease/exonuclease/phosphatase family protein [Bacteroidia bacterium]MCF8447986.1 endonuclease/exonuclease/phosphatase family protein [Bacteroidia bacterium]
MKYKVIILLLSAFCFELHAQNAKRICVAFYNQENLFDTLDTPNKFDEEFTPQGKYHWNTERYQNKLHNMAKVIGAMNQAKGPDFLGMCEIESEIAVKGLVQELKKQEHNYDYIWFDSPDERGIDNALLYNKTLVKNLNKHIFLIDTNAIGGDNTRGIVMADFLLKNNSRLVILVNHWPSRREGEKESEFKRLFVAKTLRGICDSIQKADKNTAILVMGDFNDYPNNTSILETMQAKGDASNLKSGQYYNPMFSLMEAGEGSYKYKGEWNFLDQFFLNQNLLSSKSKLVYESNSTHTFKEEWMLETEEKYKGSPKRTFGGSKYLNGYSDHFPVYLYLKMN